MFTSEFIRGQSITTAVASHMQALERFSEESLALSREHASKEQHKANKIFWRKIAKAHDAGNTLCQLMGFNEGGK